MTQQLKTQLDYDVKCKSWKASTGFQRFRKGKCTADCEVESCDGMEVPNDCPFSFHIPIKTQPKKEQKVSKC
jgi:hypothetical protein